MATIGYFHPIVVNDCKAEDIYPEAASQSFLAGELVYLASGKVTACVSDADTILGLALTPATGTTDEDILVEAFLSGVEIEMNITNAGSDVALAITHLGTAGYDIYVASNQHFIDVGDTASPCFVPFRQVGAPKTTMGDTNGRVIAAVMDAVLQSQ